MAGDFNPLLIDATYAQQTSFGGTVVPGTLISAVAVGLGSLDVPIPATAGMVGMTWRFLHPVRPGDSIQGSWRLNRKRPVENPAVGLCFWQIDVLNQQGTVVAIGEVGRLVRRRQALAAPVQEETQAADEEAAPAATRSRRRRRRSSSDKERVAEVVESQPLPEPAPADVPAPSRRRRRRRGNGHGNGGGGQQATGERAEPAPAPALSSPPPPPPAPLPAPLPSSRLRGVLRRLRGS